MLMTISPPIHPLSNISVPPHISALPKADIHVHAEWSPRLDRVLARREGREPFDFHAWSANLMRTEPPGHQRLQHISSQFPAPPEADTIAENFVDRVTDLLMEAAADGALLVEARFGKDFEQRPDFMTLFREAERRVQAVYPDFRAQAIPVLLLFLEPARLEPAIQKCIDGAGKELFGVDFLYEPYHEEADWSAIYPIAERLSTAGLGITVHAGEVSPANITAALQVPGLTRLGHATHAGYHPHLLDQLAKSGVVVECSLTCNVVMGAALSYEAHPVRQFVERGIPVALCTDDPVQVCTTIGREYAIAQALGFSETDLVGFTRNAIQAAFIPADVRAALLEQVDAYQ